MYCVNFFTTLTGTQPLMSITPSPVRPPTEQQVTPPPESMPSEVIPSPPEVPTAAADVRGN